MAADAAGESCRIVTLPACTERAWVNIKEGWDGWSGTIPTDRNDMWTIFYNYYLNTIQDNERTSSRSSTSSKKWTCGANGHRCLPPITEKWAVRMAV